MPDEKTDILNRLRSVGAIGIIAFMVYTDKAYPWYLWTVVGFIAWGVVPPKDFNTIMDNVVKVINAYKGK